MRKNLKWYVLGGALALLATLSVVSCQGAVGPPGNSSGTVTGTVTNGAGKPVSGVKVVLDPAVNNVSIVTDDKGSFTANLPIGSYNATFSKTNFTDNATTLMVASGQTTTKNVTMKAPTAVVVTATASTPTAAPGTSVTIKSVVAATDGSTPTAYKWTQTAGPAATIDNPAADTIKVTLTDAATFKATLIKSLNLLDRTDVQGVNPLALGNAQKETFKVTVTTSSGSYSATVTVNADIPFAVSTGVADVPIGVPVLITGKAAGPYSWSMSSPSGSKAALSDTSTRNPYFIPDVVGKYTLTEVTSKATINVYGGTWAGAITGVDAKGVPQAANCTGCHNGKVAPDKFTAWSQSGHAYILSDNLTTSTHYSETCFPCHTVGFNKTATVPNNSIDEQSDYPSFLAAGLLGKAIPTAWTETLSKFPKTASMMNIQCENCHGPNNGTGLHPDGTLDAARIDISSDVCGSCHGSPPHHGKYQQWANSGHGNFTTAMNESTSSSCARCHTGQGFLLWLQQGGSNLTQPLQGKNGNATSAELAAMGISPSTAQPQTCVVCHDPHDVGTSNHTNASIASTHVRITDNTPMLPAGYQATDVGSGAICITCHNTRNGAHNDANPPTSYSAPHRAAQGDVLMGQNAYFVSVERSPHANLADTCVTCHMQDSPSPLQYSDNGAGANHAFTADINMCSKCHSDALNGEALQAGYEVKIAALGDRLGSYVLSKLPAQFTIKDYTAHQYNNATVDTASDTLTISKDNIASIKTGEIHGQQGYVLTLKNAVTVNYLTPTAHTITSTTVQFQLGSLSGDGGKTTLFAATDNIVKAGWNYYLVEGDASLGVHNPMFVNDVINATMNVLK